jgi:hypothetical protein
VGRPRVGGRGAAATVLGITSHVTSKASSTGAAEVGA